MKLINELRKISNHTNLNNTLKLRITLKNENIVEGLYDGFVQNHTYESGKDKLLLNKSYCKSEILEKEIKNIEVIK